jgi:hypothetical protein
MSSIAAIVVRVFLVSYRQDLSCKHLPSDPLLRRYSSG